MTWSGRFLAERLPTLTEVVELAQTHPPQLRDDPTAALVPATLPLDVQVDIPVPIPIPVPITEEQVINRVLADLQIQIDLMFESRLREVLAPLLERAAERLVRDARSELASTLHAAVALAVTKELERHRTESPDR